MSFTPSGRYFPSETEYDEGYGGMSNEVGRDNIRPSLGFYLTVSASFRYQSCPSLLPLLTLHLRFGSRNGTECNVVRKRPVHIQYF